MDELIGKYAYKKCGFFSGIIGKIEKNSNGITPYKLVFDGESAVGFVKKDDVVIVDLKDQNKF